jgi:hypothetical protein
MGFCLKASVNESHRLPASVTLALPLTTAGSLADNCSQPRILTTIYLPLLYRQRFLFIQAKQMFMARLQTWILPILKDGAMIRTGLFEARSMSPSTCAWQAHLFSRESGIRRSVYASALLQRIQIAAPRNTGRQPGIDSRSSDSFGYTNPSMPVRF